MLDRWQSDHDEWRLTRLTVELLRPVPVAPVAVSVSPRRQGRRIQVLDAVLADRSGTEILVRGIEPRIQLGKRTLLDRREAL